MPRFILNSEDFTAFTEKETVFQFYGGQLCYIHTADVDKMLPEIEEISESFVFTGDRALLQFSYVFDMIVTGVLLVVSIMLIAVAFVAIGTAIGLVLSYPFGALLMSVSSKSVIISNQNTAFTNVVCAVFVAAEYYLVPCS